MNKSHIKLSSKIIKLYFGLFLLLMACFSLSACDKKKIKEPIVVEEPDGGTDYALKPTSGPVPTEAEEATASEVFSLINNTGATLETRINTPEGFTRLSSNLEDFTGFIRSLPLKEAGSDVLLYDNTPKEYQDGHIAVFDLDIGNRDLQQCADSVIRIYAEYYWSMKAYDRIAFHLTNGFLMEYTKWREGNRLVVDGNDVSWSKIEAFDDSYQNFLDYLTMVFAYAGTLSLSGECDSISLDKVLPGDMFLKGGSPGHCVLVVDVAEDSDGNRCFLLAQGYMPAQDFHVLKNPLHPSDPWYYTSEITYPLNTPLYTFEEGSLVRWGSFLLNNAGTSLTVIEDSENPLSDNTETIPAMSGDSITSAPEVSSPGASLPVASIPGASLPESSTPGAVSPAASASLNLLAVGDNLIHTQVIESGKQPDGSYNYDHLYSNIKAVISAADIAVINQETILGGNEFHYSGYPNFNSPTEIGSAIIKAGFDVVLQATNHTMDMGLDGVENTLAFWDQHPEITVLGINESQEESEQIPILEKNGIKIAMLNYTYSLNGYSLPDHMPYLVDMLNKDKMEADIKKAEELADFTVVFPHWGSEYEYDTNKSQEELTKFFYDNGVDLVIGSHPHVLEPVEWIETEEGHRMLVYYSLGNFMSYQKEAPRMLGGMAEVTITKDATGTYISNAQIIPIVTHFENGPADYHYAIYELKDYSEELAGIHGVTEIARQGPFTYKNTLDLAKQILGSWFQ